MIIPNCLIQESNENLNNVPRRIYNPKVLKQIAREHIRVDD